MWNWILGKTDNKEKKILISKRVFGASVQRKAIVTAARESAQDQRNLVEKYNKLIQEAEVTQH